MMNGNGQYYNNGVDSRAGPSYSKHGMRGERSGGPGRAQGSNTATATATSSYRQGSNTATNTKSYRGNMRRAEPSIHAGGLKPRDPTKVLGGQIDPMALIASPSRGIEGAETAGFAREDQDLTNFTTQLKYRQYISSKIKAHCEKYPFALSSYSPRLALPSADAKAPLENLDVQQQDAKQSLENLLLLVRKLREGIMASHRMDAATIEVYHLSLMLSIQTLHVAQFSSTIHRLVFELYPLLSIETLRQTTGAWPCSITDDFASLSKVEPHFTDLGLFARNDAQIRSHIASLLLLSHVCMGSGSSAPAANGSGISVVQEDFYSLRSKAIEALGGSGCGSASAPREIQQASQVQQAIRTNNVFALRRLLVSPGLSMWQKALVHQVVPRMRTRAWEQVKKTYTQAPLPSATGEDWLEKALLIDVEVAPTPSSLATPTPAPTPAPVKKTKPTRQGTSASRWATQEEDKDVPEAWDADSPSPTKVTEDLATSLSSLSIQPSALPTRLHRLSNVFTAFDLAPLAASAGTKAPTSTSTSTSTSTTTSTPEPSAILSEHLGNWRSRMVPMEGGNKWSIKVR